MSGTFCNLCLGPLIFVTDRATKSPTGNAVCPHYLVSMAERRDTLRISVTAREAVEIEGGLVLPPGTYPGTRTRIGVALGGRTSWTPPRYKIELTGLQLAAMRVPNTDHLATIDFDVTPLVNTGKLRVF